MTHPHEVHRLTIAVGTGFDDFSDRYEQSVPAFDSERFAALVSEGATWTRCCAPPRTHRITSFAIGRSTLGRCCGSPAIPCAARRT
jgi:hypothetical protein